MTTTQTPLDATTRERFGDRMVGMLNESLTGLLVSLGHRVGLFDALASLGPATSSRLAEAAACNARYVREWLDGLTVSGILVHDAAEDTYRLPPEHAAWLTTAAGANNLARTLQFVPMLAEVHEDIASCVRNGDGLSYDRYRAFHAYMDDESRATMDAALVDTIVPLVPGLAQRLGDGIEVADIGCGSGHAVNVLARAYPRSRLVGYDFSEPAVTRARCEALALDLPNATFELRDVADLGEDDRFDLVMAFDAVHDQRSPARVLEGVWRALRPGGTFLMADIKASSDVDENLSLPLAPTLYGFSVFHCLSVSLGQSGAGLGTVWGRELATAMLHDAGFTQVEIREIEDDPFDDFYVCTRA